MTFGSLFSGIGGIDLGLERAGMKCKWQVEIDDYCIKVLEKHWPKVKRFKDVKTVGLDNLAPVDLICGGVPCQPWSVAGKQRGEDDDRNLWPDTMRIVREVQPRYLVLENVPGLIPNAYFDQILDDLENASYEAWPIILPAAAFDAPHLRYRVFIVGNSTSRDIHYPSIRTLEFNYASKDVADTECGGLQDNGRQSIINGICKSSSESFALGSGKGNARVESTGWPVEPNVGRVASGLSSVLDETIKGYGYEHDNYQEAITKIDGLRRGILREMWSERHQVEPPSYQAPRTGSDDLMYEVSCFRTYDKWKLGQRLKEDEELRDLWDSFYPETFQEAQLMQSHLLERIREKERNETVASDRVNRLKALGNAVVSQVAEWIGRRIMEWDSRK